MTVTQLVGIALTDSEDEGTVKKVNSGLEWENQAL